MFNVSVYSYSGYNGLSNIYSYYLEGEVFDNIKRYDCYSLGVFFIDGVESTVHGTKLSGAYYRLGDKSVKFRSCKCFDDGFMWSSTIYCDGGSCIYERYSDKYSSDRNFSYYRNYYNHNAELHNESGSAYVYFYYDNDKYEEYWLEGEELSREEWEKRMSVKLYW